MFVQQPEQAALKLFGTFLTLEFVVLLSVVFWRAECTGGREQQTGGRFIQSESFVFDLIRKYVFNVVTNFHFSEEIIQLNQFMK